MPKKQSVYNGQTNRLTHGLQGRVHVTKNGMKQTEKTGNEQGDRQTVKHSDTVTDELIKAANNLR